MIDPRFDGFPPGGHAWFDALAANMNKSWYDAHKADFKRLWVEPMHALLDTLAIRLERLYGEPLGSPKVFRIHNDTRFHKGRPKYKTHISGYLPVAEGSGVMTPVALYLSFGHEAMVGAGQPTFDKAGLAAYRAAVVSDGSGRALEAVVEDLKQQGVRVYAFDQLKRGPAGLTDHPRVELLKLKGLLADPGFVEPELLHEAELVDALLAKAEVVAPLVRWIREHVVDR